MFKKKNSINNRLEAPIPEFKEAKKTKRKPTARQPKPPKIKEKKQKKQKTFTSPPNGGRADVKVLYDN